MPPRMRLGKKRGRQGSLSLRQAANPAQDQNDAARLHLFLVLTATDVAFSIFVPNQHQQNGPGHTNSTAKLVSYQYDGPTDAQAQASEAALAAMAAATAAAEADAAAEDAAAKAAEAAVRAERAAEQAAAAKAASLRDAGAATATASGIPSVLEVYQVTSIMSAAACLCGQS